MIRSIENHVAKASIYKSAKTFLVVPRLFQWELVLGSLNEVVPCWKNKIGGDFCKLLWRRGRS
jgi:hypothetical protein